MKIKLLFISLFLLVGCSISNEEQAPEVTYEKPLVELNELIMVEGLVYEIESINERFLITPKNTLDVLYNIESNDNIFLDITIKATNIGNKPILGKDIPTGLIVNGDAVYDLAIVESSDHNEFVEKYDMELQPNETVYFHISTEIKRDTKIVSLSLYFSGRQSININPEVIDTKYDVVSIPSVIESKGIEVALENVYKTNIIEPDDTSGGYAYFERPDQADFLVIEATITNNGDKTINVYEDVAFISVYTDIFESMRFIYQDSSKTTFNELESIAVGESYKAYIFASSDEVFNEEGYIIIMVNGFQYLLKY